MVEEYYTVPEISKMLKLKPDFLYKEISRGELKAEYFKVV